MAKTRSLVRNEEASLLCVLLRVETDFFVEREPRSEEAPESRVLEMILIEEVCVHLPVIWSINL